MINVKLPWRHLSKKKLTWCSFKIKQVLFFGSFLSNQVPSTETIVEPENIFRLCSRIFKILHEKFHKILGSFYTNFYSKKCQKRFFCRKWARFHRNNDRFFHYHFYQENYIRFRVSDRSVNQQHVVIQPILILSQTAKSNKCYDWSIFGFGNFHSERTC